MGVKGKAPAVERRVTKHFFFDGVQTRVGPTVTAILLVIVAAAAWKAGIFRNLSLVENPKTQQDSIDPFHPDDPGLLLAFPARFSDQLANEGLLPGLGGAIAWLNSSPLNGKSLRGKVVLVDIWTYSCINSLRQLPYIKAWAEKYKDQGLIVIGIHAPEFGFEKERPNVERAVRDLRITYPIAIDSNHAIWQAFNNEYWPADYFIDAKGKIRYHHFGEGEYDKSERVIQQLLRESGVERLAPDPVTLSATGIEAAPSRDVQSPETYIGYARAERFASPGRLKQESRQTYNTPVSPSLNEWGLSGSWSVGPESAVLLASPGKIVFRFHSRDLHLVLGPAKNGTPVRFRVRLSGASPGIDCGTDTSPDGSGDVREPRLYQLIRQKGNVEDRTFEIEFTDPGVQAFSFTFG
jgi:thiol-disulfide isomerase/thioredoxin